MDYLYELLDTEDILKIPKDFKQRFEKLTLSKKKQIRKSINLNISNKDLIRSLNTELNDLLSDDSSEGEADEINKILLSQSTKSKTNNDKKTSESCSKQIDDSKQDKDISRNLGNELVLSDSDATFCPTFSKLEITENMTRKTNFNDSENFERLHVTDSQKIEAESPITINTLSQRISSLKLDTKTQEKNHFTISDDNDKVISKTEAIDAIESVLIISSSESTPIKQPVKIESKNSNENISEENKKDYGVIVLDDSEEESLEFYEGVVSNIRTTGQTSLCTTLSNTRADRLDAFLKDLSVNKNRNPYRSDESNIASTSVDEESIPSVSIEIAETSTEQDKESSGTIELDNDPPITNNSVDKNLSTIEDNSPLLQNENEGSASKSIDTSDSYEEKISICAKFNIKIHISEPKITVTNKESPKSDEKPQKDDSDCSGTPIQDNKNQSPVLTPSQRSVHKNEKFLTPKNNNKNTVDMCNDKLKLDGVDSSVQEILSKMYGNEWQTPEVIKKLDKGTFNVEKANETKRKMSLANFSLFHKNIRSDFESTRLETPIQSNENKKCRKFKTEKKIKKSQFEVNEHARSMGKTKYGRTIKAPIKYEYSENSSSDSDWMAGELSSDDELKNCAKKTVRTRRKVKNNDEIIYLDLSHDVVRIVDNKEQITLLEQNKKSEDPASKLDELLESCTFKPKEKIESISTKTKRKLFTPQNELDEETSIYNSPIRPKPIATKESQNVMLSVPLSEMFAPPKHRQLEIVAQGAPIFKTPNSKTPNKNQSRKINGEMKENESPTFAKPITSEKKGRTGNALIENDNPKRTYSFLHSLDIIVPRTLCHPDALIYREKFKTTKVELTEKLYNTYNNKIFNDELNVPVVWNKKLLNTAGRCTNKKRGSIRSSIVELSDKVLTSADRLRCTLIHELCHAATWIFNEEHGHGATWKSWAKKSNKIFPELPKIEVCHQYDIEYKYTYKCKVCASKSHAHSKSKKVDKIRCALCFGAIEIFINKKNKEGQIISTPVKSASGFAKFVQAKYKEYKKPHLNHAEVMRILGSEFASLSVEEKNKF